VPLTSAGRATACGPLLAADRQAIEAWFSTLPKTSRAAAHRWLRTFYATAVDVDAFTVSPLGPLRRVTRYARDRLTEGEAELLDAYLGNLRAGGRTEGLPGRVGSALRSLFFHDGPQLVDLSEGPVMAWIARTVSASVQCQRWTAARGVYHRAAADGLAVQIVHPAGLPTRTDRGRPGR
jgi:hypothetical protein